MATYIDTPRYNESVQAILTASMDEHDLENAIKIALGELLDIWPKCIRSNRKVEVLGYSR